MKLLSKFAGIAFAFASCHNPVAAVELFPDMKPFADFKQGMELPTDATIGGYPIFKGTGRWTLVRMEPGVIGANGMATSIHTGWIVLVNNESDGNWFGSLSITANLNNAGANQYLSGSPCSGTHIVAVNKVVGQDDNCLTIDAGGYQSGGRNLTYFSIKSTQSASGGRVYVPDLRLPVEMLGFRDTSPGDWTAEAIKSSPSKIKFVAKLKKWGESFQEATQRAIGFSKPQDAFVTVPSYRSLLDVPKDLSDGSFTQQFISAVEHERNAPQFKAIAYTKLPNNRLKWAYSDEHAQQEDADKRALEICNTARASTSEPCQLYDLSKLSAPDAYATNGWTPKP